MSMASKPPTFDKPKHIKYWKRCSSLLPNDYQSTDASRISLGFFIVAALDLLGILETEIPESERKGWIDWIYACQVPSGGFRAFPGTNLGAYRNVWNLHWDPASLPSTYLALLTLLILGDDLGRVKRKETLTWLGRLQKSNGSFGDFEFDEGEMPGKDDLRMCYCAAGTAYILQSGLAEDEKLPFDEQALMRFISNCQGHDGGFGQAPLLEAHSGLNFCAIAAMGCLDRLCGSRDQKKGAFSTHSLDINHNIEWILQRQTTWVEENDDSDSESGSNDLPQHDKATEDSPPQAIPAGFNGRLGKMADTCYCFWNTGALAIFDQSSLEPTNPTSFFIDTPSLRSYILNLAQHQIGGFSKSPGAPPDVMHSYLGLATLAVYREEGLKGLDPVLVVSKDAADRLEGVAWRKKVGGC